MDASGVLAFAMAPGRRHPPKRVDRSFQSRLLPARGDTRLPPVAPSGRYSQLSPLMGNAQVVDRRCSGASAFEAECRFSLERPPNAAGDGVGVVVGAAEFTVVIEVGGAAV